MATRTSLYLTGDLEKEVKSRAQRRFGSDEAPTMGHIITRQLSAVFEGYEMCRHRIAEKLTYEELRFLLHVIGSEGWDEDDLDITSDLPHDITRHWTNIREDVAQKSTDEIDADQAKNADWQYWDRIDPNVLADKVEAMHLFDVLALMDGLLTVLKAERKDRELTRLFKGLQRPV